MSDETTPNDPSTHDSAEIAETVERAIDTLFDIGRLWASHGLSVGRGALETSAQTLRTTAELLGELSEKVSDPRASSDG